MWFVNLFRWIGAIVGSIVLLILRLFFGYQIFMLGLAMLKDMPAAVTQLTQWGVPYPETMAQICAYVETIGGLCLILGLLSRLVAIPLIAATTSLFYHQNFAAFSQFWSNPSAFMAAPEFMLWLTTILVLCFGPGCISLDHYFMRGMCCGYKKVKKPKEEGKA